MQFLKKESAPKIIIGTSIILMSGAIFLINLFKSEKNGKKTKIENEVKLKKEKSKKIKKKFALDNNQIYHYDTFLTDNDKFLYIESEDEEKDTVKNCSIMKKSKIMNNNPKVFLSDNEQILKNKKRRDNYSDTKESDMNNFYFAMMKKLKE